MTTLLKVDNSNMQEQVLRRCVLVKQNKFGDVAEALSSINIDEVLCSSDSITSMILLEQAAYRLLKGRLNIVSVDDRHCLKYIEQIELSNRRMAIVNTDNAKHIRIQTQLLFDKEVL